MDYSDHALQSVKMLQHALLRAHAGMNTLHRYHVSCIGYRFANVFVSSWLGSCSSHLPAYLADDCRLVSLTGRHIRSADTRTCVVPPKKNTRFEDRSFSNSACPKIWNSLPSAVLLSLNNIVNPTCLMRVETEALRDSCFYGRRVNSFYVCTVCMYVKP